MKLASYEIREAIWAGEIHAAAQLLLVHFGLSPAVHIGETVHHVTHNHTTVELLVWVDDEWYCWQDDRGFTSRHGSPPLIDSGTEIIINFFAPHWWPEAE